MLGVQTWINLIIFKPILLDTDLKIYENRLYFMDLNS